jgi:membrane protease YdiL (CAAX protease family)
MNSEVWKDIAIALIGQLPFIICAIWVIPSQWKKMKSTFTDWDSYKNFWIPILALSLFNLLVTFLFLTPERISPKTITDYRNLSPVGYFFLACIVAPIAEECFFRHLIFANFKKNNLFPYLLSVVSFILVHFNYFNTSLVGFLNLVILYLPLTVYLIFVYYLSDWNLTFPIVVHFLNNLVVFIALASKIKLS